MCQLYDLGPRVRLHTLKVIEEILAGFWNRHCKAHYAPSEVYPNDQEGQGEGKCGAEIYDFFGERVGSGEYTEGGFHAEMDALFGEHGAMNAREDIDIVHISSPPCPRCAVILSLSGIKDIRARTTAQRMGPSANWPAKRFEECVAIITEPLVKAGDLLPLDVEKHKREIFSYFQAGAWYVKSKK